MSNETGDMKNPGNFRRVIDIIKADALYNPSNALLEAAKAEKAALIRQEFVR
jgi:hypothetical protein